MRFTVADEQRAFAEAVRAALEAWEPADSEVGAWLDDRDHELARRLADAGWAGLEAPGRREAAIAGGIELGRVVASLSLIDDATLRAPLAVGGRARHGSGATRLAVPSPGVGIAYGPPVTEPARESTLDATGTTLVEVTHMATADAAEAAARWRAWSSATLAYAAGLAAGALETTLEHTRSRRQFGSPLAALPGVRAQLARAAVAVEGLTLVAWASEHGSALPEPELLWAGAACAEVTAIAHQVHGASGFTLDAGLHRYHRRARSLQTWTAAVCAAAR